MYIYVINIVNDNSVIVHSTKMLMCRAIIVYKKCKYFEDVEASNLVAVWWVKFSNHTSLCLSNSFYLFVYSLISYFD